MYRTKLLAAFCLALLTSCAAANSADTIESAAETSSPEITVINTGVPFPEGPLFKGKTLYYVGYGGGGVYAWDGKKNKVIFNEASCGPNSVTSFFKDLLVACYDSNSLVRITTRGKVVGRVDRATNGAIIEGPNDFARDGRRGVLVTASGPFVTRPIVGKVFRVTRDLTVRELADDIHYANGILLINGGKKLLVGEPEAQRIISFKVRDNGSLTNRRLFLRLNKLDPEGGIDAYPDGIKMGPDGNIWVAEYSKGRVAVVSPNGKKFIRAYDLPGQACTNIAFPPRGNYFVATCVDDLSGAPWPGSILKVALD